MCMEHSIVCKCGRKETSINFKNEIMPPETIISVYCPHCSGDIKFNPESMVADNHWILEYDMEIAKLMAGKLPWEHAGNLSPELLFDEGYCTWRGVYPGDHLDSVKEREEILAIAKTDPKRYLTEMKSWANDRMDRLRQEGWRKAHDSVLA